MTIGDKWGTASGPAGSVPFDKLPVDLQNLVELAKLSLEQLAALAETTPRLKQMGREEIRDLVRGVAGEKDSPKVVPAIEALEKAAKSFGRRAVALVGQAREERLTDQQKAAILAHLDDARQQVRDALGGEGLPPAPLPTSSSDNGPSLADTTIAVEGCQ